MSQSFTDIAKNSGMPATEQTGFARLFERFEKEKGNTIQWDKVKPPPSILPYAELSSVSDGEKKALLDKIVILKLNGGLGTTMGCTGPKSVIEVRSGLTFLDIIVQQLEKLNKSYNVDVPLVLMNSFNTHDDTQVILKQYENSPVSVKCFNQSRYLRIDAESLLPLDGSSKDHWYPPGHGDVYQAFANSEVFQELRKKGKEYVFISNVDNLGATLDLSILKQIDKGCDFAIEVTDKTLADVKGGTLIEYEGSVKLLEIAQVPKEYVEEFKSIKKFKIFNTNNMWASMKAIEEKVKENSLNMEVIVNNKAVGTQKVIQLEQAAGAAIQSFKNAIGINVPRTRFLPVKTTNDLFLLQSNLYEIDNATGVLGVSSKRVSGKAPAIHLGSNYQKVPAYQKRLDGIPDIMELDELIVSGDVSFGKGVVLRGKVAVVAGEDKSIAIPPNTVLENNVVHGMQADGSPAVRGL